jgi:hypothetical protein
VPDGRAIRRQAIQITGFFGAAAVLGALAGVVWTIVVDLPGYQVGADGKASSGERGLAAVIGADAWFTLLGLGVGLILGVFAWFALRWAGWLSVVLAVVAAMVAALLCWYVGTHLGPNGFSARLAAAQPGDVVPIDLLLHAKSALLVWPFAATIPVLVGASLSRDTEEPKPLFRRRVPG